MLDRRGSAKQLLSRRPSTESAQPPLYACAIVIGTNEAWKATAAGSSVTLSRVTSQQTGPTPREIKQTGRVTAMALSNDGATLCCSVEATKASTSSQLETVGKLVVMDVESGEAHCTVEMSAPARAVSIDGTGVRACTAAEDGLIRLWDVPRGIRLTGARGKEFRCEGKQLSSVALSPRGDRVATGGTDGAIRVYDVRDADELAREAAASASAGGPSFPQTPFPKLIELRPKEGAPVVALGFSADSRVLGFADGATLVLWSLAASPAGGGDGGGKLREKVQVAPIEAIAVSADSGLAEGAGAASIGGRVVGGFGSVCCVMAEQVTMSELQSGALQYAWQPPDATGGKPASLGRRGSAFGALFGGGSGAAAAPVAAPSVADGGAGGATAAAAAAAAAAGTQQEALFKPGVKPKTLRFRKLREDHFGMCLDRPADKRLKGLVVVEVDEGGLVATKAKEVKRGDVIQSINGRELLTISDLQEVAVALQALGSVEVEMTVLHCEAVPHKEWARKRREQEEIQLALAISESEDLARQPRPPPSPVDASERSQLETALRITGFQAAQQATSQQRAEAAEHEEQMRLALALSEQELREGGGGPAARERSSTDFDAEMAAALAASAALSGERASQREQRELEEALALSKQEAGEQGGAGTSLPGGSEVSGWL